MTRLPTPPADLATVSPQWQILPPATESWRIDRAEAAHPQAWNQFRTWGPHPEARFDHHLPLPRDQAILLGERAAPFLAPWPTFHLALAGPALHLTLLTAAHGVGAVLG